MLLKGAPGVCKSSSAPCYHRPETPDYHGRQSLAFHFRRWWHYIPNKTNDNSSQKCGPWYLHDMDTFSALLAFCEDKPTAIHESPKNGPVMRSLDIFVVSLNKLSSNGNIFRVTVPLCRELIGHQWIPRTKASDAELWCLLWFAPQ